MHSDVKLKFLKTDAGEKLAYKSSPGKGPTLIWCGGLKSDMEGGKATHLHDWAMAGAISVSIILVTVLAQASLETGR